jgi:hypothetical protein
MSWRLLVDRYESAALLELRDEMSNAERIAHALERIAAALERRTPRRKGDAIKPAPAEDPHHDPACACEICLPWKLRAIPPRAV